MGIPRAAAIMSQDWVEAQATEEDPWALEFTNANAMGTGPYKFVEWQPNEFVRMERNDDYYGGPAPMEGSVPVSVTVDLPTAEADGPTAIALVPVAPTPLQPEQTPTPLASPTATEVPTATFTPMPTNTPEPTPTSTPTRVPVDVVALVQTTLPPVFAGASILLVVVVIAAGLSVVRGPRDI